MVIFIQRSLNFTWDEGLHVSFTNHDYVKELFDESVNGEQEEYEVVTGNYFKVIGL